MRIDVGDSDAVALRIGRIAMAAARAEVAAAELEIALVMSDQAAFVVFGQGWSAVRDGIRALLKERIGPPEHRHFPPDTESEFRQMLDDIARTEALMRDRNDAVHAVWPDADAGRSGYLWKRWAQLRTRDWTLPELDDLAVRLSVQTTELIRAAERVRKIDGR